MSMKIVRYFHTKKVGIGNFKKVGLTIGIGIIITLLVHSASGAKICSYDGPDVSDNLQLTDFLVNGGIPVLVGENVSVSFTLTNVGNSPVTFDGENGVFVGVIDPDGDFRRSGNAYQGEILYPDESLNFEAEITMDKEGEWSLWPSYCIKIEETIRCGPEEWHACEINAAGIPDLIILDVWGYPGDGVYTEIRYSIQNVGNGSAPSTTTALFIDGVKVGEHSTGSLAPNEWRVESFPFEGECSGDSDTFTAIADFYDVVDELDEDNNKYSTEYPCPGVVERPDLKIVDVWHEGEENYSYAIREYTSEENIRFRVKNTGDGSSPQAEIRLYIDGRWSSTDTIPPLDPGEEYVGNFTYTGICSGDEDEIFVMVDPQDQIPEENEDNNNLTEEWECYVVPEERSDLVIRRAWLEPLPDYKYRIGYEIRNQGEGWSPGTHTGLYVDDVLMAEDYVDRLAPGESVERTFWWNYSMAECTRQSDTLRIFADYENEAVEANEGNNNYTLTVDCMEIPAPPVEKPDLIILQAWYDFPAGTDDVTIHYRIMNRGNAQAPESTTKIYIGYQEFDTDTVPPLDPGESVDRSFNRIWHPRTTTYFVANYSIEIVADAGNRVDEIPYEDNNIWRTYWEFPLTCDDGIQNRDEEGVDCGGSFCPPCDPCNLAALPSRFDWRDYYTLPPVRNQGRCGSCWAFTAVGAVEGTYIVEQRGQGTSIDLSEQNLVSDCGCPGCCWGGWPHEALNYIKNDGIVDEACFPYQSQFCRCGKKCCVPSCTCDDECSNPCTCNRCTNWNNRLWRIDVYDKVPNDIEEIKRALICHGPLAVGSRNWTHAIVLVGYDDSLNGGSWIIRNSWGTGWGNNGYGTIPYHGHAYSDLKDYVYYAGGVISP